MAAKVRASRSPSSRSSDRYSNALLGQPQYHNHQDDDHQHPNNDANDASVHFASVKFRGQQHFRSGRASRT